MSSLISKNPASGENLGEIMVTGEAEVKMAVLRARQSQPAWKALGFDGRARYLWKLRRVIYEKSDNIASLISRENGKPLIEAISHDILPAMDLITYFAKNGGRLLKQQKIPLGKWGALGHRSHLEFEPYGVIGVISPWNFPFSIPVGYLVMALSAGNTVVLKPSEYTSMTGLLIGDLFEKAGLPNDVVQVLTGDGTTGAALIDAGVDKICFTGSVATGKKIMESASRYLIPVSLELGGKDPMIVLPDADMDLASSAAVWGAFCNSGQVCASVERVYVHESRVEEFTRLVVEKTKKLRQGLADDCERDIGSMTAEMQLRKVASQVEEALEKGARVLTGGRKNASLGGYFYEPTVLTNVTPMMSVIREETFGPVLPIMTFATEDEAILLANDSRYALNAYIWTGNIRKGKRLASRIDAGTVNVNESVFSHALPQTPWGGPKESGIGRTHGAIGLLDLVKVRHVHVNTLASKFGNFWWFGYSASKTEMMKALCAVLFGRPWEKAKGLLHFVRLIGKVKTL